MPDNLQGGLPVEQKVDILLVDDLPEKLLVLQTVLDDLGQNLVLARSGAEALREVLKRDFAVILLDVHMPDIDGMETASLIRRYKKSALTPIIFITAYADELQTQRGYALGAVDYILSPVIPEVLRSKVRVFVELHLMQLRLREQAEQRIALAQAEVARQAAEENARRIAFLVRAGHSLGSSLDTAECARRLLQLVIADGAALALLLMPDATELGGTCIMRAGSDGQGGVNVVAGCTVPPALATAMIDAMQGEIAVPLGGAVASGGDMQATDWPDAAFRGVIVPMRVGGRPLGVLVVFRESQSDFAQADVAILEQLAGRAATALENARLYSKLQWEIVERQEAELKLEDANRRKDEFIAMLSHELRNPLAPIRSAVEVMRRTGVGSETQAWARDMIERQVVHLTRLVDELLDVARIAQGKVALCMGRVRLDDVIEQALEAARKQLEAKRHELKLSLPPGTVWMPGDSTRLVQVLSNLLNNAAKYTPDGGRIELSAEARADELLITVRDNGIGIEPELLPRIFDLFAQGPRTLDRSEGGLGVGLTLVRQLVRLHGGRVESHSDGRGCGAEFRVYFPLLPAAEARLTAVPALRASSTRGGRRVLVVDDNSDAAESIAIMLNLEGHTAEVALDGVQALDKAATFKPDVVLLDIGLPGVSGYDVARRMQSDPAMSKATLIALTGYGQPEDVARVAEAGFHRHFVKPVEPQLILQAIGG